MESESNVTEAKVENGDFPLKKTINEENRGTKRPKEEDEEIKQLPEELRNMFKPLNCELCRVTVPSPLEAYSHYQGKVHNKAVNAYMKKHYNIESALKKKKQDFEPIRCEVCNIELSSPVVYQQHIAGKQHKKQLRRREPGLPAVTKTEIDPSGRFGIGKAFYKEIEQQTTNLVESVQPGFVFCDICNIFTNTEQQLVLHKQGQKHIKNQAKLKYKSEFTNVNSTNE